MLQMLLALEETRLRNKLQFLLCCRAGSSFSGIPILYHLSASSKTSWPSSSHCLGALRRALPFAVQSLFLTSHTVNILRKHSQVQGSGRSSIFFLFPVGPGEFVSVLPFHPPQQEGTGLRPLAKRHKAAAGNKRGKSNG